MNTIIPTKYIYNSFPAITGVAWYILVFLILLILLFLIINVVSGIMAITESGSRSTNIFGTDRSITGAASEFLSANSLIAKIAFLLMVLVLFVVILRLGISFMSWLFTPSTTPHLLDGMIDSKQTQVYPQDPRSANATPIVRSTDGLGFTWSVWIFLDDYEYLRSQYKHVFSKGNSDLDPNGTGLVYPNNAPGVYLTPNENNLLIIMNTFEDMNENITIKSIPINKWMNIIIRCDGSIVDVYINGTIAQSIKTKGVIKQNYGDVYMSLNGGFSGNTSNLWYYNYPLGTAEIQALFKWGPNTNLQTKKQSQYYDYLSLRWFFGGVGDQYYPHDSGNLVLPR